MSAPDEAQPDVLVVGTEATTPEVLHASTTVAASHQLDDEAIDETPRGRLVVSHARAERWAQALSAAFGTFVILVGLLLGAAAAYSYGDPTACAAYTKAHPGGTGFGCADAMRKFAILGPMLGFPLLVIGWLAWVWIPERAGHVRTRLLVGLLGVFAVLTILSIVGISNTVR